MNYRHSYLLLFCAAILTAEPLALEIKSQAAILYNPANGAILYEKNSSDTFYPASITKVATALYALSEKGTSLNKIVTADQEALASITLTAKKKAQYSLPAYWLETDGSHIGIKIGEQLPLKDLIAGMMISSGNDAANVIAQYCERDISRFSEKLTAHVSAIGCRNTTFVNPHGLHHPKHVTTAYDMALIAAEAMKYPQFREIVARTVFARPKTNKQPETKMVQTNRLLRPGKLHYPSAIGVKTGYTSTAQSTLVAAAEENGRLLIAVLLKCKEREDIFKDAANLFKAAFAESLITKVYLEAGQLAFEVPVDGLNKPITVYIEEPLTLTGYPAEEPELKAVLAWETLTPPIVATQKLGTISLVDKGGNTRAQADLLSQTDVGYTWLGWLKNLF
jgi:D-alanyl-D-alanine carboxypeptidase (penicillin-binding protein 5/6)